MPEFDPALDSISSQKTTWKGKLSRIILAKVLKMRDGRKYHELVLTLTDLALEQARDQAEEALLREQEMCVPVPLPDAPRDSKLSASSGFLWSATGS